MSLRVLHVVGTYPTPEQPHAAPFLKTQVESLRAVGVACDVLVLKGRGALKYLTGRRQVGRALREADYDLIHAHYAYCAVPSFGHGLPVVTSFLGSDLYGPPRPDGSFAPARKAVHHALCRWCIARSAAGIVKADRMKADLERDVHVIPNGVNCDLFQPLDTDARAALREEMGFAENARYVIFGADPARARKRFGLARDAVVEAARIAPFPLHLIAVHGQGYD
ncbi:MAG: glycosyltransferase, partial [Gemmatimonadetes bacterium]|nr:glycosyltransferase [Gemmatimonadota bacterium]